MSGISEKDIELLGKKGISREKVSEQIETFREGIPFVDLEMAAVVGNGISKFFEAEGKEIVANFEGSKAGMSLLKLERESVG